MGASLPDFHRGQAMETKGSEGAERKLTAIMAADVVGYSRLMGDDHEATLEALTASREIFSTYIASGYSLNLEAPSPQYRRDDAVFQC